MRIHAWAALLALLALLQATCGRELLAEDGVTIAHHTPRNPNAKRDSKRRSPGGLARGEQFCQGTLISPDVVLTAASCFFTNDTTISPGGIFPQVRVGGYGQDGGRNGSAAATALAYHKRYNWRQGQPSHDIALLKLDRRFPGVTPLRLAPSSKFTSLKADTQLSVLRWGPAAQGRSPASPSLLWSTLKLDSRTCAFQWPDLDWGSGDIMCARPYGHGKNSCRPEDGGGPVFLEGGDASEDVQVGIISERGCDKLKPSERGRLQLGAARNWIHAAAEVLRTRRTFTGADPFWIYFKDQWANWLEGGDH
ncbi:hypothetical protein CHLNCDRAFT_144691 [Chlorella variabilis]|uniref:Peptidase S1 domain-containing protein n=1 Tax=Chlorella variabilis TaxID=554065 RepID=E1ZCT5_CHLVA|nr:hypothetical protein CHLNCDRAFT_144691 [Chlorella variabilis]EFN56298.1 hypothetical protein CHLNCDRAFT_144691 [Chlorella variabilis]|eukprot:XP_005848400.1 hypothetical protein CHLNCDRAFT_144691 [Chlorella variabilis]